MVNFNMLLWLLGGMGLFLYGMKLMGDGLESAAGSRLKFIVEKVTANPLTAVLVGATVTAVIQSSSATTVMVVGFVNSGIMNLTQATGIIMGANIGTTATAFLVSLKIDTIIPLFLIFGSALLLFSKSRRRRDVAMILLGFGLLMYGMETMKTAMDPLASSNSFREFIATMHSHWYLDVLIGMGMTLILQSSSATTGILIALTATGTITLSIAFPFILGANVGTCITALLSSITANKTARRAAVIHLLFNLLGVLIILPFSGLILGFVPNLAPNNMALQIAFVHLIFNIINTMVLLPFSNILIRLSGVIVGQDLHPKTVVLDRRLLQTPSIAEGQVILETSNMAELAKKNVAMAVEAFVNNDLTNMELIYENEARINELAEIITRFLVDLSGSDIDIKEFNQIGHTYHVINDIERMGDHAENIIELAEERNTKGVLISPDAKGELGLMYTQVMAAMETAIAAYRENNPEKALAIPEIERNIDDLQREYRDTHIQRLNAGKCTPLAGIMYLDLLSNLERIGDHSLNIAETITEIPRT
ncbi:Sodium-dependent phosphate transporter [Clostridiaceae bacterium JG1575]|nr:Sodium-dependent phosphate transporter [Clostridiaceae bacterium JG1575]